MEQRNFGSGDPIRSDTVAPPNRDRKTQNLFRALEFMIHIQTSTSCIIPDS
jgi:hypothetical protein